ncbi:hypothetical protein [Nitriliruptor alkaliphilus]|uniref:hypothetical protein n=1 Tax=Nitriliruptor alkaliphilus TaxID=427918 RepID=UPI000695E92B|nr:hypothetical protein [Nitriliruptor alkaliphilus]
MKFSDHFGIARNATDDWFDPDLHVDTRLFVDPFFLWEEDPKSPWGDAHDELLDHFKRCYTLVSMGGGPTSNSGRSAAALLRFPEPDEFCLGYTSAGTRGTGGGKGLARRMLNGIAVAVRAGLTNPQHIEEVGFLTERVGADGISDATCNILKGRFVEYTQQVATARGVPTKQHQVRNAAVDLTTGRWISRTHELPTRPDGRPVILVPQRFLSALPVLNANDWFDSSLNSDLRNAMNVRVGQRVPKSEIVELARRHPERIHRWADHVSKNGLASSYDMEDDPLGVVQWQEAGKKYASAHPLTTASPATQDELEAFVDAVIEHFKHFVEQERGWSLLWNENGSEKREEAAQLLMLGVSRAYCRMHGVEMDREVEMGKGPVDFKLSSGPTLRVLIEVKKLHNGKFWDGLRVQLPTYMKSDKCEQGRLLAVRYRDRGSSTDRIKDVPKYVADVVANGFDVKLDIVDARRPKSASKAGSV